MKDNCVLIRKLVVMINLSYNIKNILNIPYRSTVKAE